MIQIWEGAVSDGALACAISNVEIERDKRTIRRSVTSRGSGVLLLDLPLLDETVLKLLEHGSVSFAGHFHGRRSKKDQRPKFLWGFWSLVCDVNGCLYPNPDPTAIFYLRQLSCLFKKLAIPCSTDRLKKAVEEYHEIESNIIQPVNDWTSTDPTKFRLPTFVDSFNHAIVSDDSGEFSGFLERLDKVARVLVGGIHYFDSMSSNDYSNGRFKHGPGVVSNQRRGEYKYSFSNWSDRLEGVFPFDWCSGQPLGSYPRTSGEEPGRLAAVPKTAKGPRLIASEPVENQWCQQKIATFLDRQYQAGLIGKFIDLHDQTLSQRLVAQASVNRSLCTIDLSSASDRISPRLIESLFRWNKSVFEAMYAVRTGTLTDNIVLKRTVRTLKFTTMGSALTFPVQSLLFLCITLACAGCHDKESIDQMVGKVRVYGDDIIAPVEAYEQICVCLSRLGLKVNERKSFHIGHFRESCGADYWNGWNITPVKPKHVCLDTPESFTSLVDTSNNLYKQGMWRAADVVTSLLPAITRSKTFEVDAGVPALVSYIGRSKAPLKWCTKLHVWYSMILAPKGPIKRVAQDTIASLSEHFTRPFSDINPRVLGVATTGKARLALSRVLYDV